jgi:dihydrofolate synthase / folylpolyglutamate synthase
LSNPAPELPFASLQEALDWLDSFIDYESAMPSRRALPTLDRMWELVRLLGDPQHTFKVVHLTGTNGKGSTAAMVTSLLGVMGLSVGTYTSPNLSRVNERIARHGQAIDDESLTELLGTAALAVGAMNERPTRFEILTAAALRWFADEAVDVAVVEVGLGGTWDSTNVVEGEVAVVTNISFDHTDVLGPTLEGIAWDKSGIVKPGSRVVVGETAPELVEIIRRRSDETGAIEVWVQGEEFDCSANRVAVGGRLIDLRTPGGAYGEVLLPFHGRHQGRNAACALAASQALLGAPLPDDAVEEGFARAAIPGRLEVVGRQPLWLVDGAHNVAGMAALADAIEEEFEVGGPRIAVVGMLRGRDPSAMLEALRPSGITTVLACAPDSPRAQPAEVVAEAANALGLGAEAHRSVGEAVAAARSLLPDDGMCVIAGSLYVVADARELLLQGVGRLGG